MNIHERNLIRSVERKYTKDDITNWVRYGVKLGLFKVDGTSQSSKKVMDWIDYLIKSRNINI